MTHRGRCLPVTALEYFLAEYDWGIRCTYWLVITRHDIVAELRDGRPLSVQSLPDLGCKIRNQGSWVAAPGGSTNVVFATYVVRGQILSKGVHWVLRVREISGTLTAGGIHKLGMGTRERSPGLCRRCCESRLVFVFRFRVNVVGRGRYSNIQELISCPSTVT